MNDVMTTVFVTIGIASFIGVVAMSAGIAFVFGRNIERGNIRAHYRLVSKTVWALGEQGMVLNLTKKKLVVPPGEIPPEQVTIVFPDHSVVLAPAATVIADTEDTPSDNIGSRKDIE